jgi:PBP1b-binding outer membrane lipoprotein LpoB
MLKHLSLAALLALSLQACGSSKTKRVDIGDDDEIMGTGIESADVESMAQLARVLLGRPELTGPYVEKIPTVAISPVVNNTRFDFDGELFVRRIRQQLVEHAQGRIRFVTRDELDEMVIDRERAEKREGERTATKLTTKTGADYYLTGTASGISKVGRGLESDAIWVDFRLLDAENGELVWEKGYATKKVGKAGVIYR